MMKITPCQANICVMLSASTHHRSHFGSRYKLGCCGHASLFATCGGSILDAFRNQKATRVHRTRWEGWPNNMVRTEGVTSARHPYTCGSIPQHNTLQHPGCTNRCLVRWASQVPCKHQKCKEVERAHHTEVIASCSELLSLHCPQHPLLLALLPACAGSQVIMRQDCSAYAEEPLRTVGLLEAAHQYSLQDLCGSACTPIPTPLPIQE